MGNNSRQTSPTLRHMGEASARVKTLLDWITSITDDEPRPPKEVLDIVYLAGFELLRIRDSLKALQEAINDEFRE